METLTNTPLFFSVQDILLIILGNMDNMSKFMLSMCSKDTRSVVLTYWVPVTEKIIEDSTLHGKSFMKYPFPRQYKINLLLGSCKNNNKFFFRNIINSGYVLDSVEVRRLVKYAARYGCTKILSYIRGMYKNDTSLSIIDSTICRKGCYKTLQYQEQYSPCPLTFHYLERCSLTEIQTIDCSLVGVADMHEDFVQKLFTRYEFVECIQRLSLLNTDLNNILLEIIIVELAIMKNPEPFLKCAVYLEQEGVNIGDVEFPIVNNIHTYDYLRQKDLHNDLQIEYVNNVEVLQEIKDIEEKVSRDLMSNIKMESTLDDILDMVRLSGVELNFRLVLRYRNPLLLEHYLSIVPYEQVLEENEGHNIITSLGDYFIGSRYLSDYEVKLYKNMVKMTEVLVKYKFYQVLLQFYPPHLRLEYIQKLNKKPLDVFLEMMKAGRFSQKYKELTTPFMIPSLIWLTKCRVNCSDIDIRILRRIKSEFHKTMVTTENISELVYQAIINGSNGEELERVGKIIGIGHRYLKNKIMICRKISMYLRKK